MDAVVSDLQPTRWKHWLGIWLLAIAVHLVFFLTRVDWSSPVTPARVEIESIDNKRLEAIRKQWSDKKQFLLNKDPSAPKSAEAPPKDARYESDRNQRVEKEQKARNTQVVPRAGAPSSSEKSARTAEKPHKQVPSIPKLQNMGIPFRLEQKAAEKPQTAQAEPAGDQYVREKLPEGSENLLNTQESVYYSFYSRIYNAIGPIWESRTREITYRRFLRPGDYATVVDIVLDSKGELLAIRHLQDSGIPELDHAVDSSWHRMKRFPNPPRGLMNPQNELHMVWTFTVHIDESAGIQYMPPERLE